MIWGCEDTTLNNYSNWDGRTNTLETVRGCGINNAAGVCFLYRGGGYSDWYLPAIEEWKLLYQNLFEVSKALSFIPNSEMLTDQINVNEFWTSTNYKTYMWGSGNPIPTPVTNEAFTFWVPFNGPQLCNISVKNGSYNVRAIRKF